MNERFKYYDTLFIALLVYLFVLQLWAIWPFTIDDMYISLRYAKHLVAGDGLLWNVQEAPVEGYSNFSFVLLGSAALYFNLNPVIVLKSAGVCGLALTSFFLFLMSRYWFNWRIALLPVLASLLYKGQIIWAVSGLETTVYEALIAGSVYFIFAGMGYLFYPNYRTEPQPIYLFIAGVLLTAAALTRPEAPALILLFSLLIWCDVRSYKHCLSYFFIPIVFLYLPYFCWRWHYYGYLFPNPIYCKGWTTEYFLIDRQYVQLIWPFVLLSIPAVYKAPDKRHYFLWLPSILYLAMLWSSEGLAAFYNRLFLPAFVLLLPLSLVGLSIVIKRYTSAYSKPVFISWLIIILLLIPKMSLGDYRFFSLNPQKGELLRHEVIDWLASHAHAQDNVVLGDSGMIPYHSKLHFVDSYCLNNKVMGHYPKQQRYQLFCDHLLQTKPAIIILTSLLQDGVLTYAPSDLCLKKLLEGNTQYHRSRVFSSADSNSVYSYELYANF